MSEIACRTRVQRNMTKSRWRIVGPIGIGIGIACAYAALNRWDQSRTQSSYQTVPIVGSRPVPPVLSSLASFSLTDQRGTEVSLESLKGKTWIAGFAFTRCKDVCPLVTKKMSHLYSRLAVAHGVRFVSISSDPEFDTPEILAAYAEQFGANVTGWSFVTGKRRVIVDLVVKGFKLAVGGEPDFHSGRFILIDAAGKVRGHYDSNDDQAMESLAADGMHLAGSPLGTGSG